jgi:tetratricopeptide (TPR) repeat protein
LVEALVLKYGATKEQRWLDEAERTLQAAEALNPDSVAVLMAGGRLQTERGNQRKALDRYQRVAEREPRNVEMHLRIAKINDELGLRKEAIESYQRAIALDPGYYETYEEFGVFYDSHGEYANAVEQYRNRTTQPWRR